MTIYVRGINCEKCNKEVHSWRRCRWRVTLKRRKGLKTRNKKKFHWVVISDDLLESTLVVYGLMIISRIILCLKIQLQVRIPIVLKLILDLRLSKHHSYLCCVGASYDSTSLHHNQTTTSYFFVLNSMLIFPLTYELKVSQFIPFNSQALRNFRLIIIVNMHKSSSTHWKANKSKSRRNTCDWK